MAKKNILVTGATGFVGFRLVKGLLEKKNKVRVLVRKSSNIAELKKLDVEVVYGGLENYNSLKNATKNVEMVFHCAALLGSPKISLKEILKVNVDGTENLLKASVANKVNKFIHISSVASMGVVLDGDETTKCNPKDDYSVSKYKSELVVKKYSKKIKTVIIRPTIVYGPGEIKNRAKLFRFVQKGIFRIIGNGKNLMSLVYVDDLVNGIVLSANKKRAVGQTYIISDKRPYTMNEFISTIAKAENVKMPGHLPLWIAKTAAFFLEIIGKVIQIRPILDKNRVRSLTKSSSFSISKAEKELGYKPKVSLEEGVKRSVDWYKKKGILS